jgi:hypothetical protein
LAFSDEVKEEVMQIVQARAGEWLAWEAFRSIIEKHKIGSCFGHLLHRMVRDGQLLEQIWYFGSEHPGQGNYLGFGGRWGSIGTEGPRVLTYTCGGGPKPLAGDLLPVRGRAV